jgi:multiple sugar transport system ATP-binding protein
VRQPRLFLMDEPLSNLDAKLRVQMRADIARLQHELEVTTIYVTHDQVEAMTMGDRIAVLRKGVLQQIGPPQELYDRPANLFVGTFIGSPAMNLFRAAIDRNGDGLAAQIDGQHVALANGSAALAPYVGREVAVGVRPEHLTDAALGDRDAPRVSAAVTLVEALGSERLVHLELGAKPILSEEVLEIARDTDPAVAETLADGAESAAVPIVARFDTRSRPEAGTTAEVAVDTANLHIFDLDTGLAIA